MKTLTSSIGRRITTAREAVGISRAELARRVYVDRSVVSRWESNERIPSVSQIKQVSRILEIPISQLIEE